MVIFISGKMSGLEDLGRGAFNAAEARIREQFPEAAILNPACLPIGLRGESYMPICLAMLREADTMILLQGWNESAGSILEYSYALNQNKTIIEELDSGIMHTLAIDGKPASYFIYPPEPAATQTT